MAALLIAAALLAGCASAVSRGASAPPAAATAPLATSMTEAGGEAWAIVAMGGPAAAENAFWELFTRPAGSTRWELDTPPGVADNGGLVASGSGSALTVAVRPSQRLTFSPLAATTDGGKTWGTGLIDAPVAAVPDALAPVPAPALPEGSVSTTYEHMITFGVEYGPYTRLAAAFRDRILGRPVSGPPPATFADGVAMMTVLDAIRRSADAGGAWTRRIWDKYANGSAGADPAARLRGRQRVLIRIIPSQIIAVASV